MALFLSLLSLINLSVQEYNMTGIRTPVFRPAGSRGAAGSHAYGFVDLATLGDARRLSGRLSVIIRLSGRDDASESLHNFDRDP